MFDHVSLSVTDLSRSRAFYTTALTPLGIHVVVDLPNAVGFGRSGRAHFWIGLSGLTPGGVHLAFAAASRADVRAFHAAALDAGGTDNGAPALRPHYHPNYYGAFVLDPDGYNVEAVCRNPED